jgi:hypothetical protein
VAPFRRRQQPQHGEKPQRHKFDRELYELARLAAGPDSAAGASTHPDAIRLLGTRAAEHRWAIQRPGIRPILVLTLDVMTFIRIETGEVPLATQALDQALIHLDVLAGEGRDVSSALAFHRKLRAAF